ncbi:unnamed protein product, partial [Gulo gulo]
RGGKVKPGSPAVGRCCRARSGPLGSSARHRQRAPQERGGSRGRPERRVRRRGYLGALVEVVHGPRAHEGELHVRVRVDAAGQDQLAGRVEDPQAGGRAPGGQQVAPERPHRAVLHQHVGHLRQ